MIDLSKNGSSDTGVPCPMCRKIVKIASMVGDFAISADEDLLTTIDILTSEVRMWRTKDSYEKKLKSVIIGSISQKIENEL